MKSKFFAALLGGVSLLYAQIAAAPLVQSNAVGWVASQYVLGEVLVKFKPASLAQERTATVAGLGHTVLADLGKPGWMHVKLGAGRSVEDALAAYRNDPSVEAVQPNFIY